MFAKMCDTNRNIKIVIKKFLEVIPIQGISDDAFETLCIAEGRVDIFLYFERSVDKLLKYIEQTIDKEMINNFDSAECDKMHQKIISLLQSRLKIYAKMDNYREYLNESMQYYSLKINSKNAYLISDIIWNTIKDSSTDFNFYTKRIILGFVYFKVIKFFINDYSCDHEESFKYLEQKIQSVLKINSIKFKLKNVFTSCK
ncbi:COQ9 family protein [Anaplasmataceae bacterium AB001_6]|nr:COQ9 family protein [Anaplasmataceae bacterium AB001_6]